MHIRFIMRWLFFLCLFVFLFVIKPLNTSAQTTVTFRIDMRVQMKDSTFISGDHSIELKGNLIPFSDIHTISLHNASSDSIFATTVRFPSLVNEEILKYKYIIRTEDEIIKERRFRLLPLKGQEETLPIAGFNNFAH